MENDDIDHAKCLPPSKAAEMCGVSPGTLRGWRVKEYGPVFHMHGRVAHYTLPAVQEWTVKLETRWTLQQTAEILGVSPVTLSRVWRPKGKGPEFHRYGGNGGYYDRDEVLAWKETHAVTPQNASKVDTATAEDCDWSWATAKNVKRLMGACRKLATHSSFDAEEIMQEASMFIAVRPDYFEKSNPAYAFDDAARRALRGMINRAERRFKHEVLTGDDYWSMT